jgi:hypothetical protein
MRIENTPRERRQRAWAKTFHVPTEEDDVRTSLLERTADSDVQKIDVGMRDRREVECLGAGNTGPAQCARITVVANHSDDTAIDTPIRAGIND